MIPVEELLYKLDMRLNKKSTLDSQTIPKADALFVLNEAQIKLIKQKLTTNNIYNLGFDSFTKRYEDLQGLVVNFEKVTATKTTSSYPAYTVNISSLTREYMFPIEMFTICSKGKCTKRTVPIVRLIRHGDVSTTMNNSNTNPSFEYQETVATISENDITIYTDSSFTIDEFYISYIRYPQKITLAGIPNIDGTTNITQNCELPSYLQDELLDIATQELAMETENNPQVQYASQLRTKINE